MSKVSKYNDKLNIVGEKINYYRKLNNWSLTVLSNKLQLLGIDISKSSLQKIENGTRCVKEYEFYAFAKTFNISMEKLLEDFIKAL